MNIARRVFRSNFFIKLLHWEYWPFGIVQAPFFLYWLWFALRERSLFFFSASNPSILTGGMMGESKFEVLQLVPDDVKPKTILISLPASRQQVMDAMLQAGLSFPVIFKPDLGERGWLVKRIEHELDIDQYLLKVPVNFIVQELVDLPLEFAVYYVHTPNQKEGMVTSITAKEFLSVTGTGTKTLEQLVWEKDRAKLQYDVLKQKYADRWKSVLLKGEKLELISIGNHCLGTTFLNGNHLITPQLERAFDALSSRIKGFYFGRYDLRCASVTDLQHARVKIVELNGCGAEPAHIYQPGASLFKALQVLHRHWVLLHRVSRVNHQRGVPYLSFKEGKSIYYKTRAVLGKERIPSAQ